MKIHIVRSIARLMPKIFRPIRAIRNFSTRQNRLHFGGQSLQSCNKWISVCSRSQGGEAHHFAAQQKRVHPTRRRAKLRIVQHHAAIAPFRRACIIYGISRNDKLRRSSRPHKTPNLCRRRRRLILCASAPWCNACRYTTTPRISGLCGSTIRINQRVTCGHIHQNKGIEHHL